MFFFFNKKVKRLHELQREIDQLRELVATFESTVQKKDAIIDNLSVTLGREVRKGETV